jgi:hypothetical protein
VKLPEFDGKKDVHNFFAVFERACISLGMTDEDMLGTYLLGRLRGAAQAWSQGINGGAIAMMGYSQLKRALCDHFHQEGGLHVRALERLRQGTASLEKFNEAFNDKVANAHGYMTEMHVKDLYVQALTNNKLRDHLSMALHLSLPQLQTKAADFMHVQEAFARAPANNLVPKTNHQN